VPLSESLSAYVQVLSHWNRTVNLTALELDPPGLGAIERLIIEPLAAARFLRPGDRRCLDVGSGGGSPAIPLKLVRPDLAMVLVESRSRKAAFLREAARQLQLRDVQIEPSRAEALSSSRRFHEWADVVTIRAVRVDDRMKGVMRDVLVPGGRIFWFRSLGSDSPSDAAERYPLGSSGTAELAIISRRTEGD